MSRPSVARLQFHCQTPVRRPSEALLSASTIKECRAWAWTARFRNPGRSDADVSGESPTLDAAREDACSHLCRAHGISIGKTTPSRACVLSGPFNYPSGRKGWYRLERKSDGTIWTVEIVDQHGECFDSVEFPGDVAGTTRASDEQALVYVDRLLAECYGAKLA